MLEAPPRRLAPDTPVDACIRPTQIMIFRLDRPPSEPRQNTLHGSIAEERIQAETYRLSLCLLRSEPGPAAGGPAPIDCLSSVDDGPADYDLEIELPGYVHFRLGLDRRKDVTVSVRRDAIHVVRATRVSARLLS